ncbi:MAG: hypothetical protein WCE79_10355 [Xanthobacteraceae bacterium]
MRGKRHFQRHEAIRQEYACEGVSMVLASAPLTPALTGSTRLQFVTL